MKALKIIGISLIVLVIILLAAGFFLPKSSYTEKSIVIDAPPEVVFAQVNELRNWESWSPFMKGDPSADLNYSEITEGQGASFSWSSKQGASTLSISESTPYTSIRNDLMFDGQKPAYATWAFEALADGGVKVSWGFGVAELGWPLGRYLGLFLSTGMNQYLEKGLKNMKEIAENLPKEPIGRTADIALDEIQPQVILAIQDSVALADMESFYAASYPAIMAYIGEKGLQATGMPASITLFWNENGKSLIEAAIPIEKEIKVKANPAGIYCRTLPAAKVVRASHFGPYNTIGITYNAIEEYMKENGLEPGGAPMEIYVTDPGSQPDSSLWETKVVWPLK